MPSQATDPLAPLHKSNRYSWLDFYSKPLDSLTLRKMVAPSCTGARYSLGKRTALRVWGFDSLRHRRWSSAPHLGMYASGETAGLSIR